MIKHIFQIIILSIPMIFLTGLVHGQSGSMVEFSASLDNTLYENAAGNTSNGVGEYLFVGKTNQASRRRALIFFDLGQRVPTTAVIDSVRLILHMSKTTSGLMPISLHKILTKWGEGNSNAANQEGSGTGAAPGDATWIYSQFNSARWNQVGGDFGVSASANQNVTEIGFYRWGSTPAMISDVQSWLLQPSLNFGWLLLGNESALATAKRFDSRQNIVVSLRPKLVVYYSEPLLVTSSDIEQPNDMTLGSYPNPFNSSTAIVYSLNQTGWMSLKIFDMKGQEIFAIDDGTKIAGEHTTKWEGKDRTGRSVASGVYLAILQTTDRRQVQKMMLVR